MAIVVNTTTVIDDSRVLQNITGATGNYDSFHPNVRNLTSAPTANVSMTFPFQDLTLAGNANLSVGNKALGRTSVITIDRSASGFTPTFDANVKWPSDSQPVWADHRYWNVALVCWDATIVRAAAVGYDS